MITIIAIIFAVIVGTVGVVIGLAKELDGNPSTKSGPAGWIIATIGILISIVIVIGAIGFRQVGPGQVGVKTQFGQVQEGTMGPGLHWVIPFVNGVTIFDGRVQAYNFEDIEGATRDLQTAGLSGLINFHINADSADDILQTVGGPGEYAEKVLLRPANTALKEITPQYNASEVIAKRDEIGQQALERLSTRMERYGIVIDRVSVENIALNEAFLKSVEDKQIAEQNLFKADFERQTVVKQAEGARDAAITRAEGEAEANRLINESLTDNLLTWRYIDKLAENIKVMLLPSEGGSDFILDLKQLDDQP